MTAPSSLTAERADLLETLANHRYFLQYTIKGITDEQAAQHTTVSELCLGGLLKHVALTEEGWADFIVHGLPATEPDYEAGRDDHTMLPGDTLADLFARYEKVATRTDELVRTLPDLDATQLLPQAPWFEPGARWSARRVLLHITVETAQHAGHADIIRESLDGQKTMG